MSLNLVEDFLLFLENSPSPYHATYNLAQKLLMSGFEEKKESKPHWTLKENQAYFTIREGSSIVAWIQGKWDPKNITQGRMIGAHTDSPGLKVRPNPVKIGQKYIQLGTEVYGGPLLGTWFDCDLSLAGRVCIKNHDKSIETLLIDFKRSLAYLPNLAIHLNREANENRSIQKQKELYPILSLLDSNQLGSREKNYQDFFHELLKDEIRKKYPSKQNSMECVLTWDMFFYDTQKPKQIGLNEDFIASARLDNLLSCFISIHTLIDSWKNHQNHPHLRLVVCNDHEEVGSASSSGAEGTFLKDVLKRIVATDKNAEWESFITGALFISADNAHGIHPNYPEKHDGHDSPILNQGPVIKINANQRYATSAISAAPIEFLAQEYNIKLQWFANRSDLGCGSTIGPLTSKQLGIKTLDIGVPTFAMHSTRELAGSRDLEELKKLFQQFFIY